MPSQTPSLTKLGKNGPAVPALGFGTMSLTHNSYGTPPTEDEIFTVLDRAYELGSTFWDSADLYGDGEAIIGKWFKRTGKRDEIFLATKFGFVKGDPTLTVDSSGEYCKKSCAESLRLLDIDSIDLYYLHHANTQTPIEETMRAMAELQNEGKIKHIGLSAISSKTLRRAVKIAPVAAVQVDYSLFVLDIEGPTGTDLLATCRELGVAVVAAMPLGRGMITPTYASGVPLGDSTDRRRVALPRFMGANKDQNVKVVARFGAFAEKKGCTMPQLALAWLLKQGSDIIPIPGTKQIKYLEENWASLNIRLTDEEESVIRDFAESAEIGGPAMPPKYADYNFRDTVEEA